MAGLAALYGQQPNSLKDLYLADPRYQMAQRAMEQGSNMGPAQGGWGEGLARAFQGAMGGYLAGKVKGDVDASEKAKQQTLADSLALGRDMPAQSQSYGDGTTINWEQRKGSPDAMISALMGNPDTASIGMGVQGALMDNQMASQQKLQEMQLAQELEANKPITPYQQEQLSIDREKLAKGSNGISYTMPDGTQIQIGGTGGKLSEAQGQAASRSNLISEGLKNLENTISDPSVSPLRMAAADTVAGSALGDLAATKLRTDKENIASAGRDSALEGLASAVTGAGVTKDQFTRFSNMLPKAADSQAVKDAKFDSAYNFLLTQTNIAGPIADQIKQRVIERAQQRAQPSVGASGASGGSSTTPPPKRQFNAAAAKAAGYTDAEIEAFLKGQQ